MLADPMKLALADKSKPLTVREATGKTTCAIYGCPIDEHSAGVVNIPGIGKVCPSCAESHDWQVKW